MGSNPGHANNVLYYFHKNDEWILKDMSDLFLKGLKLLLGWQNITLWHSTFWQNLAEITLVQKFENNKEQ